MAYWTSYPHGRWCNSTKWLYNAIIDEFQRVFRCVDGGFQRGNHCNSGVVASISFCSGLHVRTSYGQPGTASKLIGNKWACASICSNSAEFSPAFEFYASNRPSRRQLKRSRQKSWKLFKKFNDSKLSGWGKLMLWANWGWAGFCLVGPHPQEIPQEEHGIQSEQSSLFLLFFPENVYGSLDPHLRWYAGWSVEPYYSALLLVCGHP